MLLRSDFVFSYWILAWFILYVSGIVNIPPLFVTILGIIENIAIMIYLIIMKAPSYNIIKFTIINAIIKGLPLWYMINKGTPITKNSIIATTGIFALYYTWLLLNRQHVYNIYKMVGDGYITGKQTEKKTMFSFLYDTVYVKIIDKTSR